MVYVEGIATKTTTTHVTTALQAVTSIVFPHHALEMQHQWMQQKCISLLICQHNRWQRLSID
jgi:hypothetical protein